MASCNFRPAQGIYFHLVANSCQCSKYNTCPYSMFSCLGATTVEAWTTMPKNVSYHPSPRSAISARASTTWSPTAQSKHSSPRRILRENPRPWKGTRRSTATQPRLLRPLIEQGNVQQGSRGSTEANQTALLERWTHKFPFTRWSCFWNYLRLNYYYFSSRRMLLKLLFSFGVTLRITAVLLHSENLLNVLITAVDRGF